MWNHLGQQFVGPAFQTPAPLAPPPPGAPPLVNLTPPQVTPLPGAPLAPTITPPPARTFAELFVFRTDKREPLKGAFVRVWAIYAPIVSLTRLRSVPGDAPAQEEIAPRMVAEGFTEELGRFVFEETAAVVPVPDFYTMIITPGQSGIQFETHEINVFYGHTSYPVGLVCPKGTDSLICEISDLQFRMSQLIAILNEEFGGGFPNDFTVAQAHFSIKNIPPRDPRLTQGPHTWFGVSAGIMDLAIPLEDWSILLERRARGVSLFNEIPFPLIGDKDWFERCAGGIPITAGKQGEPYSIHAWRLYSPHFSDYYPRTDQQVRKDMAARYLTNLTAIFGCIESRIKAKAREVQRSQAMYGLFGVITSFLLIPLTGPAGLLDVFTDLGGLLQSTFKVEVPLTSVFRGVGSFGLVLGGSADAKDELTGSLVRIVNTFLPEDFSPIVRNIINKAIPSAVGEALEAFGIETPAANALTAGALGFGDVGNIAFGVLRKTIDMMIDSMVAVGAKRVSDFYDVVADLKNLPVRMIPFLLWCIKQLALDQLMETAAQEAGLETTGDADLDAAEPLRDRMRAEGMAVPLAVERPERVTAEQAAIATGGIVGSAGLLALPLTFLG